MELKGGQIKDKIQNSTLIVKSVIITIRSKAPFSFYTHMSSLLPTLSPSPYLDADLLLAAFSGLSTERLNASSSSLIYNSFMTFHVNKLHCHISGKCSSNVTVVWIWTKPIKHLPAAAKIVHSHFCWFVGYNRTPILITHLESEYSLFGVVEGAVEGAL